MLSIITLIANYLEIDSSRFIKLGGSVLVVGRDIIGDLKMKIKRNGWESLRNYYCLQINELL